MLAENVTDGVLRTFTTSLVVKLVGIERYGVSASRIQLRVEVYQVCRHLPSPKIVMVAAGVFGTVTVSPFVELTAVLTTR